MNVRFWQPRKQSGVEARAHDLEKFKARVGLLAADDPLWGMLIGLVRRNVETEIEALARGGIGDEEAHRGRGRAGMLLEIEAQLQQVWDEAHRGE